MNPLGAFLTILFSTLAFILPGAGGAFAVFLAVAYVTQGQLLDIGGFHFHAIRIVLLAAFIRLIVKGELRRTSFTKIDRLLIGYVLASTCIPIIRTGIWQEPIGTAYNILLSYFVFRTLIPSWAQLSTAVPLIAVAIVPIACFMMLESLTGNNVFSGMGGQGEPWTRAGRLRCFGSFRGPHTAGVFGASLMPLFIYLFFVPSRRPLAVLGFLSTAVITWASNSSGPLMAFLSGIVGIAFWNLRDKMNLVRRGIVVGLVLMAIVMKAPIWYVVSKLSDVVGGDGWSRSYLMEQCFNHFFDWWLIGTDNTLPWASTAMPYGGADLCNIFVSCAAQGGLLGLVLIILLITRSFSAIGRVRETASVNSPESEFGIWCVGCVLFAHVMTLFSITYFDQLYVLWWGLFGVIGSLSAKVGSAARETASAAEPTIDSVPTGGRELGAEIA